MSFITNSTTLSTAQDLLVSRFRATTLEELEGDKNARRCFLVAYLLHSRKCHQTPKMTRGFSRGTLAKRSQTETMSAHAFFLFGLPETQFCVCVYTKNAGETNKLLQFDQLLYPSCCVGIVQPKIVGKQTGTDNIILSSAEPLVPLKERAAFKTPHLPPVIAETPDFRFLHFLSKTVSIDEPFAITKRCNGRLCDGSSSVAVTCLCSNERGRSTWAVNLKVKSQELSRERLETCEAELTSVRMRLLFCDNPNSLEPGEHNWEPFAFADTLCEYMDTVTSQNDQEIEVMGWYKPSIMDTDGLVKEPRSVHIVDLDPKYEIEDNVFKGRFNCKKNDTSNDSFEISDTDYAQPNGGLPPVDDDDIALFP